ncbi:MAG TPA: hypothetical protein VF258_08085, partial [Luteolibacter sp.]
MDSTFEGSTTRHEQTEPSPGILVLEIGRLTGTNFEPIRQETLVKNDSIVGKRIHRRTIKERPTSAASWHTVSDIETTEEHQVNEWVQTKEINDPSGAALTSTWSYYQPGELTGPGGSIEGLGRLKLFSRHDGYQTFHTYTLNETITITPYAGNLNGKVTTDTWNPGAGTRTITTTAGGQVLSKTHTIYTDTSVTSIDHISQTDTLTTVTHYGTSGQDFGGKPLRILHADGTLTTYAYSRNAGGGYTTVTENGSTANSTTVAKGTRTTTTVNSRGTTILRQTTAIGYGTGSALFDSMAVTSIDNLGRALIVAHHPVAASATGEFAAATGAAWTTTTQYSCCGVAKETDMYGIPTFHAYDALQNPIKSNRLGVTIETLRNGLTTETHPSGSFKCHATGWSNFSA